MTSTHTATDALLLISPTCPHCPALLEGLSQLLKQGLIGRLEVINIVSHPEVAAELQVRTVPWFRIGEFELYGAYTPAELKQWAERTSATNGIQLYLAELLGAGQLPQTIELLKRHPHWLHDAITLLGQADSGMALKTGLGALIEEFAGTESLVAQLGTLGTLLQHESHSVRADACYFLGLSRHPLAIPLLQQALADAHAEVQEIAREALDELAQMGIN